MNQDLQRNEPVPMPTPTVSEPLSSYAEQERAEL